MKFSRTKAFNYRFNYRGKRAGFSGTVNQGFSNSCFKPNFYMQAYLYDEITEIDDNLFKLLELVNKYKNNEEFRRILFQNYSKDNIKYEENPFRNRWVKYQGMLILFFNLSWQYIFLFIAYFYL